MKVKQPSKSTEHVEMNAKNVRLSLDEEAKLMRSAQRFGSAFDEHRQWGDDVKRLEYTLSAWRELALAALEYAKAVGA